MFGGKKKTKNTKINKPERKQGENESSWWTFDINMADIGERERKKENGRYLKEKLRRKWKR